MSYKKRIIKTGLVVFACFVFLSIVSPKLHCESSRELMPVVVSPDELSKFMRKNFKYRKDKHLFQKEDWWQTPEEFWELKKGDCEDYALFAEHMLKRMDREAFVVSVYGPGGLAHTVTIFKEGEYYRVLDKGVLKKYKKKTVEDTLSKIDRRWVWAGRTSWRDHRGWIEQLYYNS